MRQRVFGWVESIVATRPGAQEVLIRSDLDDALSSASARAREFAAPRRALNLVSLCGTLHIGDRVLLNTVAVEMRLGTGGLDFVIGKMDGASDLPEVPGHIMKLRYTPLQIPILAVEAPESPHHASLVSASELNDLPVVCAELHSQVPAICAAARWAMQHGMMTRPVRIVYIMTDGAALPLALSRLAPEMKSRGLVDVTITCGHAFGGDYEAVNLYSALLAAREVAKADLVVVAQGPGNVGTGTRLGFSGVDQGLAVNATASLGGVPIVAARISFADSRERHQGLSHHTVTVLKHIAHARAFLALPRLAERESKIVEAALFAHGIFDRHDPVTVDAEEALTALIASGIAVTTMGRTIQEERPFFLAASAAGVLAAQLAEAQLLA